MATRLYFTSDALVGIGVPTVTQDASWEQFGSLRSWLSSRKLGSGFTTRSLAETSTSGTYDSCQQQFVSKPLAAQTISGTVKAIMRCAESNVAADMRSQMVIRVVSGDGGTVRGTLLAHDTSALSNEWNLTTLQNRKFPLNWSGAGAALTSVVAQAGDRLVVEIGNRAHNTSATQYYGYIETGDGASTDCTENETDTLQYNPWIEFSQNIVFQEDVSRSCGDSESMVSVAAERKPLSQRSVQFGGTNEYVTMGDVLGFERTDSFSISQWVKYTSTNGSHWVAKVTAGTAYQGYGTGSRNTGQAEFAVISDTATGNRITVWGPFLNDNRWHHVVWTYDGSSTAAGCLLFVDGVEVSTTVGDDNLTASIVNTESFALGARAGGPGWFYIGALDDVAVYNKKLSADEVKMLSQGYPPSVVASSNLVGYWKMGDGDTYPTLTDSSSSGYNGTMTNMESSDIGYDVPLLPVWDVRGYDVKAAPDLGTTSHDYETVRVPDFAMASGTTVEPGGAVKYFKMRAQDSGASPPGYVSWVVQDDPDFAGAGYSGGSPTPVGPFVPGSIVVAAEWQE